MEQKNKKVNRVNKQVYTWIGTFLFGIFGVNRFMRGQIITGIIKLITFGLGGLWVLIDWIIALSKLGQYEKDFVFEQGEWSYYDTKTYADIKETNLRLLEAAKRGATNLELVVGYRVIEKNEELKNNKLYNMIKEICMELLKKEYRIDEVGAYKVKNTLINYDKAYINIKNKDESWTIGSINFYGRVSRVDMDDIDSYYSNCHNIYAGEWKHLIQIFPLLTITSRTPYTEAPPEWLMICAKVIKEYNISITDPPFVQKYPDAQKYVNVMFR